MLLVVEGNTTIYQHPQAPTTTPERSRGQLMIDEGKARAPARAPLSLDAFVPTVMSSPHSVVVLQRSVWIFAVSIIMLEQMKWSLFEILQQSTHYDGADRQEVCFARATAGRPSCVYCTNRKSLKQGFECWSHCHCRFELWSESEFGMSIRGSRHIRILRGRFG